MAKQSNKQIATFLQDKRSAISQLRAQNKDLNESVAILQSTIAALENREKELLTRLKRASKPLSQNKSIVESLAAHCHNSQWSGWMRYLYSKSIPTENGTIEIPKQFAERWERQMNTPYVDLPENEKQSDIKEAMEILLVIEKSL